MAYRYIISKSLDPIFAVAIGVVAAGTRINREEKEQSRTTQQTIETLKRRVGIAWEEYGRKS